MIYYSFDKLFKKSGLSYRRLAEEMGVNFTTLFKLAQAKTHEDYNLCSETINKICAFFKCQPNSFMKYKNK